MAVPEEESEKIIARLEREILKLREDTRQSDQLQQLWHDSKLQLRETRSELLKAKRRLEKSGIREWKILQNLPEGVLVTDSDGNILKVNQRFTDFFGYSYKEVKGKNPRLLKSSRHDSAFYETMWSEIRQRRVWQGEIWNLSKGGEVCNHALSISAIEDDTGAISHYTGVYTDINERLEQEEKLKLAKEKAENATRLKDNFVNLVAHDLRSPFAGILGALRFLKGDAGEPISGVRLDMIDAALENGEQLVRMIDGLLNISMLQTGKITPLRKFVDGHVVANNALGAFRHMAKSKGVALVNDVPEGMRIYVDPILFGEVVMNLVSNGVKFSSEGDTVRIYVPGGDGVALAVGDTGMGVNESFLPNLFRHDVKTSAPGSIGEKGTGLGLSYCRDIVEAHKGEISVNSVPGKGSDFTVTLPLIRPAILIVDDERVIRSVLKKRLDGLDVELIEARNGKEAMEKLATNKIDLVFTDLMMPVMDGFELLEELKRNEKTKELPVIVGTADHKVATREKVFRLGADDFVNKPFIVEDLIPRVRKFVV